MATKRMFSNAVIDSDSFLELSTMAQLLYFHLGMKTDDDGFSIGSGRTAKIIGATKENFQELIDSGFLIEFPNRVYLLRHHKLNNDLKNDRHHDTVYQSEFSMVEERDKVYHLKECDPSKDGYKLDTNCIQDGYKMDTNCNHDVSKLDTEPIVTHCSPSYPIVSQPIVSQPIPGAAFDRFWAVYPRHEAKQNAQKAFNKINPDADLLNVICAAVERWKKTEQWTKDNGKYIPHPATWLNQRRWEDDIPAPSPQGQVKRVQEQAYEQRQNDEHEMSDTPEWMKRYRAELHQESEGIMNPL